MTAREKVGVFDYQSGRSQEIVGILMYVLGMNPVSNVYHYFSNKELYSALKFVSPF